MKTSTGTVPGVFDVYASCATVPCGDVTVNVAHHGPEMGDVVLMIHGFPDSARLWRHQIPVLVESGYRVLVPDLRGFGRSARPQEVSAFGMRSFVGDMLSVLDRFEVDAAHVVGHDWGAAVAWQLAAATPHRVRSATVVSVGHPAAYQRAGLRQRQMAWYTLLFQFEGVAERWLSDNDWFWLRRWTGTDDVGDWVADLSRPGALTAALNVYRANMAPETWLAPLRDPEPVRVDVLGVWSSGDQALTEEQMIKSADFVAGEWRYERLDGVGHWIPVEAPDRLNQLLIEWLDAR